MEDRKHPTTSSPPTAVADPPLKRQRLEGLTVGDDEAQATSLTGLGMLEDEMEGATTNGKGTHRNSGSDDSSEALGALRIEGPSADDWTVVGGRHKAQGKAAYQGGGISAVRDVEEEQKRKAKKAKAKAAKERPAEFHFDTRGFKNRTIKLIVRMSLTRHRHRADERPHRTFETWSCTSMRPSGRPPGC